MEVGESTIASAFVGRDIELETLLAGLGEAIAGRGCLYLISGEAGIGKTRLADELGSVAGVRGARVLWGRCWDGDAAPAYWPWTQILRALAATPLPGAATSAGTDDLSAMVPELGRSNQAVGNGDTGEARFRLFEATALFLRRASEAQPLVLILDDMHAADESSLLLLRFCARELVTARVLLLCTYREADVRLQRTLVPQFADLIREGRRIVLSGWDGQQLEQWLCSRNDSRLPAELAAAFHHVTGGNPFFVDEIAREVAAGRVDPALLLGQSPLPVPDGVRQTITRHLTTLPSATVELLALAAIIGLRFDADVLRRLAGTALQKDVDSIAETIAQLSPALAAGLLRELPGPAAQWSFAHALVRETVRNHNPPSRRLRLHLIVGDVLEQLAALSDPVPAAQLAFHFFQGAAAGGAPKALHYARLAGDDALRRGAYEDAAAHYAQAIDALKLGAPDPALRAELLIALGQAQRCAGRIPEARAAFDQAARLARGQGWPLVGARATLGFAQVGETGVVDSELVSLLEEALAQLGNDDAGYRARLLARLAMALYFSSVPSDRDRREQLSSEAVALARRNGKADALGAALMARHFVLWGPGSTQMRLEISAELIDVAVRICDRELEVEGRLWLALDLLESGDGPSFLAQREALEKVAESVRLPICLWHVEVLRALWALAQGDLEGAEAAAEAGRRIGETYYIVRAPQFFAAQLFHVRRQQNRLAELEPALRAFAERFPALPVWQCGLAWMYAELGRGEDARQAVEAALTRDPAEWPADGNWLPCLVMLAEVCATLGDPTRAAQLRAHLAPHAGIQVVVFDGIALLGPVHHFLGLLAATMGDSNEARYHLTLAESECRRVGAAALLERSQLALAKLGETATAVGAAPASAVVAADDRRALRSEGAYWTVAFAGIESRVKHSRGLGYVGQLLSHPGREFHALELTSTATAGPKSAVLAPSALDAAGLQSRGTAPEPLIDAQARTAYRERLRDLQEELDEAEERNDRGRVERLQEEMHALTDELSRALGLGGRARVQSSAAERARIAVTKAITTAVRALGRENPPLGAYLARTLRTGTFCSYRPDPGDDSAWDLGG